MTAQISDTFTYRGESHHMVALSGEGLLTSQALGEDAFPLDPDIACRLRSGELGPRRRQPE